jgi:hypothetical protein
MKKSVKLAAIAVIYLGACYGIGQYRVSLKNVVNETESVGTSNLESVAEFSSEGYVRYATYFADEWPVNFWNSEMI